MFDRWFNLPAHKYLHLTALLILAVGISLSNVLMSIGSIWIISNALIQGDFKAYWERIKTNKFLWLLIAFIFLHFITLAWSENLHWAFKDLRMKLPLFVIPLVMGIQKPLAQRELKWILLAFIVVVALTSILNFVTYNPAQDIREMSRFLSHIRFAISLNIAIAACFYLIIEKHFKWFYLLPIVPWLIYYLYKSQALTGYIIGLILLFSLISYFLKAAGLGKSIVGVFALFVVGFGFFANHLMNLATVYLNQDKIAFSKLELYSPSGNPYYHDTTSVLTENGNYVWIYVQHDEMRKEWNQKSTLDYDGEDRIGQPLYGTLMRYLTSKNLRKDSTGVVSLSENDIRNVENGKTSITANNGLQGRFDGLLIEMLQFKYDADPNGSSLLQRKEHLRIAFNIVKENWIMGVGIGDVIDEFDAAYVRYDSPLIEENRWRSHNQYLTTWIGLGIIGLFLFIGIIIYPLVTGKQHGDFLFKFIGIVLVISALFQDIIETQAGITIFSFFLAIAIFAEPAKDKGKQD